MARVPAMFRDRHQQRLSYTALWRAACEGDVPAFRRGGRWFVTEADLPHLMDVMVERARQHPGRPAAA